MVIAVKAKVEYGWSTQEAGHTRWSEIQFWLCCAEPVLRDDDGAWYPFDGLYAWGMLSALVEELPRV